MEHSESSAETASSLADPNGFRYGAAGANESELTIPRASLAPFELPPESPTNWHVHLELRPEELLALHRLGLTKGAIAWREGMPAWQPLRESNDNIQLGSEVLARAMDSLEESAERASTMAQPGPQESWSDAITIASDRGSEPVHEAPQELLPPIDVDTAAHILPPRVRRATLPPTSPLFAAGGRPHVAPVSAPPRTGSVVSTLPPSGTPDAVAALSLPSAPRLPSFSPEAAPVFAAPALPSAPPPATVFEPSVVTQPGPSRRALWMGAIGLAAASAFIGAFLSGTFKTWSSEGATSAASRAPDKPPAVSTASEVAAKPAGVSPISIEQLPLAGAAAAAAESSPTRASAASAAGREKEQRASKDRDRPRDTQRESARAAAPEPPPAAPEPSEPPSEGKRAIMAAMAQAVSSPAAERDAPESAPEPREPEPEPSRASEGADLKAISRAVGNAARSATSCGESPQSGRVAITFSPSGAVRSVQMEEAYAERDVGACVLRAMGRAKVSAFTGDPVTVRKSVSW